MTATTRAVELAELAAEAAADKLASDIIAYDVSEQLVITDVFLLCSAANDRQVRAIVDAIEEKLRKAGARPVRREGEREGRWVLLDYLDIVVHVQHAEERTYYAPRAAVEGLPADASCPSRSGRARAGQVRPLAGNSADCAGRPPSGGCAPASEWAADPAAGRAGETGPGQEGAAAVAQVAAEERARGSSGGAAARAPGSGCCSGGTGRRPWNVGGPVPGPDRHPARRDRAAAG